MTLYIQEVGLTFGPSTQLEVVSITGNKENPGGPDGA
jgi:hypothetical protein